MIENCGFDSNWHAILEAWSAAQEPVFDILSSRTRVKIDRGTGIILHNKHTFLVHSLTVKLIMDFILVLTLS